MKTKQEGDATWCKTCDSYTKYKDVCAVYGKDNPNYGSKRSEATKEKMRKSSRRNENNSSWKGNNAGYGAIHLWVKKHWPDGIPKYCSICKMPVDCNECRRKIKLDLCNISLTYSPETYNRDFKNWFWACRSCHIRYDDRNRLRGRHYVKRDSQTGRWVMNENEML